MTIVVASLDLNVDRPTIIQTFFYEQDNYYLIGIYGVFSNDAL